MSNSRMQESTNYGESHSYKIYKALSYSTSAVIMTVRDLQLKLQTTLEDQVL